jgi:hypothetical protein
MIFVNWPHMQVAELVQMTRAQFEQLQLGLEIQDHDHFVE